MGPGVPTKLLLVINGGSYGTPIKGRKLSGFHWGYSHTSISEVIITLLITGRGPSLYGNLDFFCVFSMCQKFRRTKRQIPDAFLWVLFLGTNDPSQEIGFSSAPFMLVQVFH